jgi:hypothetical protein
MKECLQDLCNYKFSDVSKGRLRTCGYIVNNIMHLFGGTGERCNSRCRPLLGRATTYRAAARRRTSSSRPTRHKTSARLLTKMGTRLGGTTTYILWRARDGVLCDGARRVR